MTIIINSLSIMGNDSFGYIIAINGQAVIRNCEWLQFVKAMQEHSFADNEGPDIVQFIRNRRVGELAHGKQL